MKKLKIKGNKTKIINEERQDNDFKDLMSITGGENVAKFGKEIGRTLGAIGLWGAKSLINFISSVNSTYFKEGKEGDWRTFLSTFLAKQEKNSKSLKEQINKSLEGHEKNFQSMLSDIGLSEKEMNVLLAAGSPPLAINNILFDMLKKNKSSTFKEVNATNLMEAIGIILTRYMTNDDDSPLKNTITSDLSKYIKTNYSKNTKEVFERIHQKEYFNSFIDDLIAKTHPVSKNFSNESQPYLLFLNSVSNPSINNSDVTKTKKNIRDYLEGDIKSRLKRNNENFIKKINLNNFLIKEISEEKIDSSDMGKVLRLAVVISICFCRDEDEKIKEYIFDNAEDKDLNKIQNIVDVIKNKNEFIKYSMVCLSCFAIYKAYADSCTDFSRDLSIDFAQNLKNKINEVFSRFESDVPSAYTTSFNTSKSGAIAQLNNLNYDHSSDDKKKLEDVIQFMNTITGDHDKNKEDINLYIKSIKWSVVGNGDYLRALMENNVLSSEENTFIRRMKRECNIDAEYDKVVSAEKVLREKLDKL